MEKRDWRSRMKRRHDASDPARNRAESFAIAYQMERWLETSGNQWCCEEKIPCAAVFAPRRDEPDIRPVWHTLKSHGFRICLPACATDGNGNPALLFHQFSGDEDELAESSYGLMEPHPEALPVLFSDIRLVMVPGMAFSTDTGVRLGRGKGYYDRFLAQVPGALRMAPVFGWQIAEDLPFEAQDQRMDLLVTAEKIISCKR